MKSKNALLSAVAALAIGVGSAEAMAAASPEAADYVAASSQGTIDALQGFIAAHPTSPLAADALTQIAQLQTPDEGRSFFDRLKDFFVNLDSVGSTGFSEGSGPGERDSGHESDNPSSHSIY